MRRALVAGALLVLAACREPSPPAVVEPVEPTPVEPVAAPLPPTAKDAAPVVETIAPVPPRDHLAGVDPGRCRGNGSGDGPIVRDATVHRWVDAQGIRHFSDQPPVGEVSDHRVISVPGTPPVSVEASGYDVNLPTDLNQRAVADALAIDRILRETLGVAGEQRLRLKIVFVGSPENYAKLIDEPRLAASDGAYSARNQTVYVKLQASDELAFRVLRHEIAHALLHERIGNLSLPINEGIAAYFERLQLTGQGGQVDIAGSGASLARAAPKDATSALVDLLASNPDTFYDGNRDTHYLQAFALIGSLMQDASGRVALADLLARQYAEPCTPVPAETVLGQAYPGGLSQLAGDWQRWMQGAPVSVHAF